MPDVYSVITERVIHLLEQGVVPWHKPWNADGMMPSNLVSLRQYRGVNVFLLHSAGYQSPYWLTFKQARELGGYVRQGEKAWPVIFWKRFDVEEDGESRKIPMLRYYSVFNVAQVEGISRHVPARVTRDRAHCPIEEAERIVANMPERPPIRHGLSRAFYSPFEDYVGMPSAEQFENAATYYSVLFHELTHATGHERRLHRKGVNSSQGEWSSFGSEPYSKEELVAEMGAAFLSGHAGIAENTLANSAAYIAGWLHRLRDDQRLVIQAAALSQKAADYILGKLPPGETEAQS